MAEIPHTPFLRLRKIILLVILGLLVYAVSLLFWIPVGWIWHWTKPQVLVPQGLVIERVAGELWNGTVQVRTQGHSVQGSWHLNGLYDDGRWLPLNWQLQTMNSGLHGMASLTGSDNWQLSTQGHINIPEFNQEIRRSGGAVIEGDVRVESLRLAVSDNRVSALDGRATWPGGRVSWRIGDQLQEATLPAMEARLNDHSGKFGLEVSTATEQAPVVTATLESNGVARIEMYRRMLDLVNQPWAGNAAPGDVIFSIEQPLLGGGY